MSWTTARRAARLAAGCALALAAAGATATAAGAAAPPATAVTALPPATTARWGWPLDTAAGPPQVLRRAGIPARPWQPGHRGVDLAAAPGQRVLAPVAGVVVAAGPVAGRRVVSIRAASGWRATLEPVAASVRVGDHVVGGQQVGVLDPPAPGATAGHCGALTCLHWGVRTGGGASVAYRDPLSLLRSRVVLLPVPGWGAQALRTPRPASPASP